jgi:hypothetical protein
MRLALVLWILGGVRFLALWLPVLLSAIQAVDDGVYQIAVNVEFAPAMRMAVALDFLGSSWITFPIMIAVGVYLVWQRRWEGLLYESCRCCSPK